MTSRPTPTDATAERRLVVLEPRRRRSRRHMPKDPAFYAFLEDRLVEEILAAARRRETVTPERAAMTERGLRLLDEIVTDLRLGRGIDRTSMELLKIGYGRHPQFRPEWHVTAA